MAKRRFRWLWTMITHLRPESAPARRVWDQSPEADRQALRTRSAYWQTDADPGLACVLADLQGQQIHGIRRGLRIMVIGLVSVLGLELVVFMLLDGAGLAQVAELAWGLIRVALGPLLLLLASCWGYQAARNYNEAVVEQAHKQPPSPAWGQGS